MLVPVLEVQRKTRGSRSPPILRAASLTSRRFNPFALIAGAFVRLPVTSCMLMASGFCFALQLYFSITRPDLTSEDLFLGGLQIRQYQGFPEVFGMFKLWEGEWWRLFVNPFYHLNFGHWFFNSLALWVLGGLIERRLGSIQLLFFCCMSCLVCSIPELLIEVEAFGLSGIIYAMFGALLILRNDDAELADRFGKNAIIFGIVWLFLCVILTATKVMMIANGAHFAGLLFGILFAFIQFEIPKYSVNFARLAMFITIMTTAALIYVVVHPTWQGRYHAWRAIEFPEEFLERANRAIKQDPELPSMWLLIAQEQERTGQRMQAFETLLRGIKANRTNATMIGIAQDYWKFLKHPERLQVRRLMNEIFGPEAEAFMAGLGFSVGEFDEIVDIDNLPLFGDPKSQLPGRLDVPVHLPLDVSGITKPHPPDLANGEVDPDDPLSARLGQSL